VERLTPQTQMKQSQPQPQPPADDWSFLDGALDWEALLDEPILETVMEDAALELSPHAFSGTTDSQRSQVSTPRITRAAMPPPPACATSREIARS
jgi:hypothetical protein